MNFVTRTPAAACRSILGLCILSSILAGCGPGLTDEEYLQKARKLETAGDRSAAVVEVRNALSVNKDNAEARFMLANFMIWKGDWATAEKEYSRSLELGVAREKVLSGLAAAYINQGKFEQLLEEVTPEPDYPADLAADIAAYRGRALIGTDNTLVAEKEIQYALELEPLNPVAGIAVAQLRVTEGDYEAAKRAAAEFLVANPQDGELSRMVAQMEDALGNLDNAIEAYGDTIGIREDNANDYLGRGLLYLRKGELYAAEDDLLEAKKRLPNNPLVHYGLGAVEFYRQQYPQAQVELEKALELAPRYMPAVYHLGVVHYLLGNYEQAGTHMARFLAENPNSTSAASILTAIAESNEDQEQIEEVLRPIAENYPEDIAAAASLSRSLLRQGKWEEGGRFLEQAAAQDPDSLEAQVAMGFAAVLKGDVDTAITHLLAARKLDPGSVLIDTLIVSAYLQTRQFDEAIDFASAMAQESGEKKSAASYLLGAAYHGKQMQAEAVAALREAIRLKPEFLQPTVLLAQIYEKNGDYDLAAAEYARGLEHHPQNAGLMLALAVLSTRTGNFETAREQLERAREANAEALTPRLALAEYYARQGDLEKAGILLDEASKYHAQAPAYLAARGRFSLKNGEPDKAVTSFEALSRSGVNRAEANYLLSLALAAVNRPAAAKKHLKLAVDADSTLVEARLALARMVLSENDLEAATRLLAQLEALDPENPEVVALRGRVGLATRDYDRAIAAFTSLAESTRSSVVTVDLARAYFFKNEWQKSIDLQEAWLRENPADVTVAKNLAQTYAVLKRSADAIRVYESVIKQEPDDVGALNDLAWLLKDSDLARALKLAQHAYSLNRDFAPLLDTMAVLYLENNQAKKAMDYATLAVRKEPENLDYKYHLARIHLSLGEQEKARAILDEITSSGRLFAELASARTLLQGLE